MAWIGREDVRCRGAASAMGPAAGGLGDVPRRREGAPRRVAYDGSAEWLAGYGGAGCAAGAGASAESAGGTRLR